MSYCMLNPIELAWIQEKVTLRPMPRPFNLTNIEQLAWEGFGIVTADGWSKQIRHVRDKLEDHYWSSDGLHTDLYTVHNSL